MAWRRRREKGTADRGAAGKDGWTDGEDREQERQREEWIAREIYPPHPLLLFPDPPSSVRPERPAHRPVNCRGQCAPLPMLLHIIDKSVCANERGRFDLMNHGATMTHAHARAGMHGAGRRARADMPVSHLHRTNPNCRRC